MGGDLMSGHAIDVAVQIHRDWRKEVIGSGWGTEGAVTGLAEKPWRLGVLAWDSVWVWLSATQ